MILLGFLGIATWALQPLGHQLLEVHSHLRSTASGVSQPLEAGKSRFLEAGKSRFLEAGKSRFLEVGKSRFLEVGESRFLGSQK